MTIDYKIGSGDTAVSALLMQPQNAKALCVLGHGAGADMRHAHMQRISEVLAQRDIATLRFNFPFKERGKTRVDSLAICTATINQAIEAAQSIQPALPLFLCGHSFGGRMASHFAAETPGSIMGLVYFSFPLHPAGKPDTKRAAHLDTIKVPQLFISGTRDKLAELSLLVPTVSSLQNAKLHQLYTADHSFKILKRTRVDAIDVYDEAADVALAWMQKLIP